MQQVTFLINPPVSARAVSDLRASVGWSRLKSDDPGEITGYWATIGGLTEHGELVAWCTILSDARYHAVLLDVIVHPNWQAQGLGRALVAQAVAHIQSQGREIIIHVDFLPERASFYERCGFRVGLGGIYEGLPEDSAGA